MRFSLVSRRGLIATSVTCALLLGCTNASPTPAAPVDASAVAAAVAPYIGTQVPGMSVAIGYHGRVIFA